MVKRIINCSLVHSIAVIVKIKKLLGFLAIKTHFWQCRLLQNHLKSIIVIVIVAVSTVFKLFALNTDAVKHSVITSEYTTNMRKPINKADLRGCGMNSDDWLDKANFEYNNSADHWTMISTKQKECRLYPYTAENVVTCIDSIHSSRQSSESLLHFVFVGDSRARQQFYNFIKFLPEYDREHDPSWLDRNIDFHIDRNVTLTLLGIHVSFLWRPDLSEHWINDIQNWIDNPPYLIFISMGIYHLRPIEGHQERMEPFQLLMKEFLLPALKPLANVGTNLIWLNQFPMLPDQKRFFVEWNGEITSETVQQVNIVIRKLLKKSRVKMWDSGNPPAEEYRRSCYFLQQGELGRKPLTDVMYHNSYFNCHDVIHPGYVALNHAMQILLNHICNKHLL